MAGRRKGRRNAGKKREKSERKAEEGPDHGSHVESLGLSNENQRSPGKEGILDTSHSFRQRECWDTDIKAMTERWVFLTAGPQTS